MADTLRKINIAKKPCFINRDGDSNRFFVVPFVFVDSNNFICIPMGEENTEPLILGRDIIEEEFGLSLAVRAPANECFAPYILSSCQRLARAAWQDYFSFGEKRYAVPLRLDRGVLYLEVRPKLFRKIVNC